MSEQVTESIREGIAQARRGEGEFLDTFRTYVYPAQAHAVAERIWQSAFEYCENREHWPYNTYTPCGGCLDAICVTFAPLLDTMSEMAYHKEMLGDRWEETDQELQRTKIINMHLRMKIDTLQKAIHD